jgi:VCBS repeat-containing protein
MLKKITPLLLLLCSFELFAAPLRLAPVAEDDFASVVVSISPTTTINIGNNDRYGSVFSIQGSTLGQYGQIQLSGNSATYTLYQNPTNAALAAGQIVTDTFTYTYTSDIGQSDSARIVIEVTGNQKVPVAVDDYASVTVGVNPSTTVNLTNNDLYGKVITINSSTSGQYGYLSTGAVGDGAYTYTLYDNDINSNLASGQVVEDVFTYTNANELGQQASARFIIKVTGNKEAPIAEDDYASVVVGTKPSATGNLSSNDRNGSIITINGSTAGRYGFLALTGTTGAYTYTLYDNSTNVNLAAGQSVTDVFTYTYTNEIGQSASASLTVQVTGSGNTPVAIDDNVTLVPTNTVFTVTGNVTDNDTNGTNVYLSNSSPAGVYGNLVLAPDGQYTYTLNKGASNVIALTAGQVVTDAFSYTYVDQLGKSATATLTVTIIGNPVDANGGTVYVPPTDEPLDNVDVEFNNRSADATPLNSGRNIKGSLYDAGDKDWYFLQSNNGDEVIHLELCPKGSSCYEKKSWVVYVFDSSKLTLEMEEFLYPFRRWVDETGGPNDVTGANILNSGDIVGYSNHMYLAYEKGVFEGALLGVIDPCFDTLSTLDIGVGKPSGPRNYLIAVSSTLMGSDNGKPADKCGVGTTVLQRPGRSAAGKDAEGKAKTYTTTEEYISAFPFSDDQYAINITGTGINPLLSSTTTARAATFNTRSGAVNIPKIRIADTLYSADLTLQPTSSTGRSANTDGPLKFILTDLQELGPEQIVDAFRATYNQLNQRLLIPKVTDTATGNAYSVIMQYHQEIDGKADWLEVIDYVLIQ